MGAFVPNQGWIEFFKKKVFSILPSIDIGQLVVDRNHRNWPLFRLELYGFFIGHLGGGWVRIEGLAPLGPGSGLGLVWVWSGSGLGLVWVWSGSVWV